MQDDLQELWTMTLSRIENPMVRCLAASSCKPIEIDRDRLVLGINDRFQCAYSVLNHELNRNCITGALQQIRPDLRVWIVLGLTSTSQGVSNGN